MRPSSPQLGQQPTEKPTDCSRGTTVDLKAVRRMSTIPNRFTTLGLAIIFAACVILTLLALPGPEHVTLAQAPGTRDPSKDFDTIVAAGNDNAEGIWSDGTTMWVVDSIDDKIYAYRMSDKSRDSAKDFDTLIAAGNQRPFGLWSDGTTMWVVDHDDDKIYAYRMSDKSRDPAKDFDTLAAAGNREPYGLWEDGTTMWVADWDDDKLYAYRMSDQSRDPAKDFDTLVVNTSIRSLWSDGTTMWVADGRGHKIYAYRMSDQSRDPAKDLVSSPLTNGYTSGIWSDRTTMWVADVFLDYIAAYHMPPISAPPRVTLDAGNLHTCGLKPDGQAVCWGSNSNGRLEVPEGERFIEIASGERHSCGLRADGRAICWGSNSNGQASPPEDERFVAVTGGHDIGTEDGNGQDITLAHSCGLKSDGEAVCWGTDSLDLLDPPEGVRLVTISAGGGYTCGLKSDGQAVCWGPLKGEEPPSDESFIDITSGVFNTCGLKANGDAVCWGSDSTTPTSALLVAIDAGADHTCGLQSNGFASCWGWPEGSEASPPAERYVAITSGGAHSCGLKANGEADCWGTDFQGLILTPPAGVRFKIPGESEDNPFQRLAEKYAPILRMHPQETVFPSPVEVMIQNATLRDAGGNAVTNPAPPSPLTAEYIGTFTQDSYEDYYLDLSVAAPNTLDRAKSGLDDPYAGYDNAAELFSNHPRRIYARWDIDGGYLILQYWFFYPLDRNHEGDWEMIQIEFPSDLPSDAAPTQADSLMRSIFRLGIEPIRIIYAAHGVLADHECWHRNPDIIRSAWHPHVFVARGSHASYYRADIFDFDLVGSPLVDETSPEGTALVPPTFLGSFDDQETYDLSLLDDTVERFPWVHFRGKWGEQTDRSFGDGPSGPMYALQWQTPRGFWYRRGFCAGGQGVSLIDDRRINSENGTQEIGGKSVDVIVNADAAGDVVLEFSYEALNQIQPGLQIQVDRVDENDPIRSLDVIKRFSLQIRGYIELFDIDLYSPATRDHTPLANNEVTVCIRIPNYARYEDFDRATIRHHDSDAGRFVKLPTRVEYVDRIPFACAVTTSFSLFALVVETAPQLSPAQQASRIEPAIKAVTLSPEDSVRLSTNIYGAQNILDNDLAENLVFDWTVDDTALEGDGRELLYTAPSSPGRYTVTASLASGYCTAKFGDCEVKFTINVRRPRPIDPAVDVSEPVNPTGQIPIVIPGADGTQHAVFTPVEGGNFNSGGCSFEAPSGAINDNEYIGIAIQTITDSDQLSPIDDPRFITQDVQCKLSAVDNAGTTIVNYRLRVAGDVCIPLPDEYRANAFDVRLLSVNDQSQTQILSTRVIINDPEIPLKLCGKLNTIPNTITAALPVNVAAKIPTPAPETDDDSITSPDTGPFTPPPLILLLMLVLGIATLVTVTLATLKNHNIRPSRR